MTAQWDGRIGCPPHNRDTTKRECHVRPLPIVHVDRFDEIRARLRWRNRHDPRTTNANDSDINDDGDAV